MYSQGCKEKCKRGTGWRWISKKQREEFNQCMDECENEYTQLLTGGNEGSDTDKEADEMVKTAKAVLAFFFIIIILIIIFKR